jgi:hypothetical protein
MVCGTFIAFILSAESESYKVLGSCYQILKSYERFKTRKNEKQKTNAFQMAPHDGWLIQLFAS